MSGPRRLAPNQLPDPWLLDSERLLQELARIREIALRIPPVRNDILGPINSVIDAVWDLEQRLRYLSPSALRDPMRIPKAARESCRQISAHCVQKLTPAFSTQNTPTRGHVFEIRN